LKKLDKIKKLILSIHSTIEKLSLDKIKIHKYKSKNKTKINPVTLYDLKIEKLIIKKIKKIFPSHSILGEETGLKSSKNSEYTWIIDPIDGTKNLILGIPLWGNLIGLYHNKDCIFSFANFPLMKKYYLGYGNNSYLYEKSLTKKKIKCNNKISKIKHTKIVANTINTFKHSKILKLVKKHKGIFRITNANAYNFCLLAEGKIDVIIESGLKKVDILPLIAIIKNSGAIITDWNGKENFNTGKVLVSSNIRIHQKLLRIIR
jgi:myo-inositol-1(or 4)-monophosphatase